jgi:hypothetical protein
MKITYTTTEDDDTEEYTSLEELEEELDLTAEEAYAEAVISQLKAGAKIVRVTNGPGVTDTYEVTE